MNSDAVRRYSSTYVAILHGLTTWFRLVTANREDRRGTLRSIIARQGLDLLSVGARSRGVTPPVAPPFGLRERAGAAMEGAGMLVRSFAVVLTWLLKLTPLSKHEERQFRSKQERYEELAAARREYGAWNIQTWRRALARREAPTSRAESALFVLVSTTGAVLTGMKTYKTEAGWRTPERPIPGWIVPASISAGMAAQTMELLDAAVGPLSRPRRVPRKAQVLGLVLSIPLSLVLLVFSMTGAMNFWAAFQSMEYVERQYETWKMWRRRLESSDGPADL